MQLKNILITGGAGFIGSNFVHYLLANEPDTQIVTIDALTYAASLENLRNVTEHPRHTFIHGNICDQKRIEEILTQHKIDTIIHFAAESHVDRSIHNPMQFVQTNVVGTVSLLEAVRKIWIEERLYALSQVHFHHVSTDEVYGSLEPFDSAFTEATPYAPNSPYAASKASSDHFVKAYAHTYGLPITLTNCSNNYGPRQFPEKLIPLIIFNALSGLPLPLYGDGQQVRDWLHVDDHCEAIWTVIQKGEIGTTYNIGGDNQVSNLELVNTICAILDECFPQSLYVPHRKLIKFVTDRPGHDRRYAMDIAKIQTELGWRPRYSLQSGLRETIDWYLNNRDWLMAVSNKPVYQEWLAVQYQ